MRPDSLTAAKFTTSTTPINATLEFTNKTYEINEDGKAIAAITVQRKGNVNTAVGATVLLSDGYAVAPKDYDNKPIEIKFAPGETSKIVTVPILDDSVYNSPAKTFNVTLMNPTGGANIGLLNQAEVKIKDNDSPIIPTTGRVSPPAPPKKLSIVTANTLSNSISVLKGNGDGTFQAKNDFTTGGGPQAITLGDVNGDGKLDVLVTDYYDNNVSVLKGNGDGTFQPKNDFPTGAQP